MGDDCRIVDEDESYNFRRFKPEELEKKYSPFEHVHKKDFPFLFQKKQIHKDPIENTKISLEHIIEQMKNLGKTPEFPIENKFIPIENPFPGLLPLTPYIGYESKTPHFRGRTPSPPPEFSLDGIDLSGNVLELISRIGNAYENTIITK